MALKDWEELRLSGIFGLHKRWIKRINDVDYDSIDIEDENLLVISKLRASRSIYPVIQEEKQFKTKSEALKYAKEYMSKH